MQSKPFSKSSLWFIIVEVGVSLQFPQLWQLEALCSEIRPTAWRGRSSSKENPRLLREMLPNRLSTNPSAVPLTNRAKLETGGFKVTVNLRCVWFVFQNKSVVNLLFAAYSGDVSALRRYFHYDSVCHVLELNYRNHCFNLSINKVLGDGKGPGQLN